MVPTNNEAKRATVGFGTLLASQEAEIANRKRVAEDSTQEPQQSEGTSPNIDDPKFLEKISEQLKARRERNKNVLLNIPAWGWTGDGKTCALLTAIHFCDPAQHPLGFALITNTDELV
jgi:hypothetical protein